MLQDPIDSRSTPYDRDYSGCERCDISLLIYTGEHDPKVVSDILGVQPTSYVRSGEKSVNSLGRTFVGKINGWFLSSEKEVDSKDLRPHLDWLLDVLEPRRAGLAELQRLRGVTMRVNCIWWSTGSGGPVLWPEQMIRLAQVNLECAFDLSFYGEEQ